MFKIVPKPKKLDFTGKWFDFDGFENFPDFISSEFSIPKGSWKIEIVQRPGTGLSIEDKKVKVWGNVNVAYATLVQLLIQRRDALPQVTVEEEFRFSFRGFHLDIARGGVPNLSTFKNILRWLFLLKYNYFAIYFEDLFPWEKHPKIGAGRGRLTKEELKDIIQYGKNLGIEVFPSLELTGHMENILSIPEYSKYSEWYLPREGCLDLSNEEAKRFAYELLEEVLEFFPSKYVHIGGDETWALGRGKSLEKNWIFEGPKLYEEHHKNMIDMVEKYRKIPIMWADMLTGMFLRPNEKQVWEKLLQSDIWQRAILANWDYAAMPKEHFINRIESLGKNHQSNQIVCPGFSNWNRFYPDFEVAIENIKNFIDAAKAKGIQGFLVTAWGDDGQECLFSFLYPLLVATIEFAEGDGGWEKSFIILSGESEKLLEVRKAFGISKIANNIKGLLYWNKEIIRMETSKKQELKRCFEEALQKSVDVNLPEDLAFIHQAIRVAIKRLENTVAAADLIELGNYYCRLWLSERKKEGLDRIVGRFWAAAGRVDLELGES
ncbi:beta-N-acetylhexosaminidase [Anaerocellum danielii]|uniref:Beta-N-acetylhexosaminidase n=1 Tax=Anaerocellum danielii TaxID=1387557 RepID=A0ABZ0U391_9FIRM|nr:beta-N-acetylhexosaminidase [Caldicellulosiruptor danielii]WPX08924.1 beta-N-acetylhexosaminidase [Caldicellulosiruptor danielii]